MAKKNSSKTATEKSISASEPRIQVFYKWQGVNFKDAPLTWQTSDFGHSRHRQGDLRPNYLVVQNNLVTDDAGSVSTRPDSELIGEPPSGWTFTGVSIMYHRWLVAAVRRPCTAEEDGVFAEMVVWRDVNTGGSDDWGWTEVHLIDADDGLDPLDYQITELAYFEDNLIAMTLHPSDSGDGSLDAEMFRSRIIHGESWGAGADGIYKVEDGIAFIDTDTDDDLMRSAKKITDPTTAPTVRAIGMQGQSGGTPPSWATTRLDIVYCYTNEYGSTLPSSNTTFYTDYDIVSWSTSRYIVISGSVDVPDAPASRITGVDIYTSLDNKTTKAFIGHVDFNGHAAQGSNWSYIYLGAMADVSSWTNVQLKLPEENDTQGVHASHVGIHDSRLYFWGDPQHPYRLYIGGNPGSELSVARGLGGAFVDIEPGTGYEVMGTAKWKTVSGASIVTIMGGNPNTNMVKRFNLVETNITITNEVQGKGYMYEEVSNVVGCNSRWGYGVFADGLYSLNRYGLMLTTMAMEYNSQMRNQNVSEVIQPIFTERLGDRLKDARMVFIDDILYIVLSEPHSTDEPENLDQIVLCYDLGAKAWYTFSCDQDLKAPGELILHAFAVDSDEHVEGLGLVTSEQILLYPTTGIQEAVAPGFNVLLETGELAASTPIQQHMFVSQLELRFDWFVGEAMVYVEGTDYYGRPFCVEKHLNRKGLSGEKRQWTEWIRLDRIVESYRVTLIGQARFRLVSINAKAYVEAKRIGMSYGFDAHDHYRGRHGQEAQHHHYIRDYNNLRRAIVT